MVGAPAGIDRKGLHSGRSVLIVGHHPMLTWKAIFMIDPQTISRQVLKNCDISDARHAGLYSICGLALRLRDLYKWDTGTPAWEEKDSAEVLDWIGRREAHWESLEGEDYRRISLGGRDYSPFDTRRINAVLLPHRLCYGAGYGHSLKPTFFLATVEASCDIAGTPVTILGRELARDLMTLPALSQDGRVLLRKEAARLYLWDWMLYVKKSGRRVLESALNACGIFDLRPIKLRDHLEDILKIHQETFIYHELGEIHDRVFDRTLWRKLVAAFPGTAVELLARSVKDLLADTSPQGPLAHMIAEKNNASAGLYAAFHEGLSLEIFPEVRTAYDAFSASGDWAHIAAAVSAGRSRACAYAAEIIAIFQEGIRKNDLQWAAETIENRLVEPLRHRDAA